MSYYVMLCQITFEIRVSILDSTTSYSSMLRRQLTVITRLSTSAHRTHTVSHTLSHPVPLSTALPSRIPLLAVSAPIATSITQQTHQIDTTAEQLQAPVYPDSLSPLLTWLHNSLASLHDATGLPWYAVNCHVDVTFSIYF
jgi:hypothetical protein